MPAYQVDDFMAAIRRLESGNNYLAQGPVQPNGNRALGAYQIMRSNWSAWSKEAGIAGADWRDPQAQDRVARYKMNQYYQRFGSWDLVAVAWFAGPGRAATALKEGSLASVGGLKDSLGTSVSAYVDKVMGFMPQPAEEDPEFARMKRLDPNQPKPEFPARANYLLREQYEPKAPDATLESPIAKALQNIQRSPLPPQAAPQAQGNRAALESRMTALVSAMSRLVAGGASADLQETEPSATGEAI